MSIRKYGRYWAVIDADGTLVCLCVGEVLGLLLTEPPRAEVEGLIGTAIVPALEAGLTGAWRTALRAAFAFVGVVG